MDEKETTRNRILKAAYELFARFGFRSISMDDIARELGMSKKTLYQFFTDKDEIVTLAIKDYVERRQAELIDLKADTTNAVEFLLRMNEVLTRNIKDTNAALIHDLKKYHANAWSLVGQFRNEFLYSLLAGELQAGVIDGVFREDIDPAVMAKVRLDEASLSMDDITFPTSEFNLRKVSVTLLDHFIHGIVTEKGKNLYNQYKSQHQIV